MTRTHAVLLVGVALLLSACGGGGSGGASGPVPVSPAPVTLALSGGTEAMAAGKPVTLTATASAGAGTPSWQLAAGAPGSLSATTGTSVNYLPPASVGANTQVTVTASVSGVSQSLTLTLYPDLAQVGLSLIAGNPGGPATLDGAGSAARFLYIGGVASDSQGRLLVTAVDATKDGRSTIRAVSQAGVVSTIFSSPHGDTDGPPGSGALNRPASIAVALDGTIYVLDQHGLRSISPGGTVATLSTEFVSADPTGHELRMIANGADGVLVMESDRISKVSASGAVSVLAGARGQEGIGRVDGQGAAARFGILIDMAADSGGNLFALDGGAVRKITPAGVVTTLASGGDVVNSCSIAVDASGDLLLLAESGPVDCRYSGLFGSPKALRKVSSSGQVTTIKTGIVDVAAVRVDAGGRVVLPGLNQINLLGADKALIALAGMNGNRSGSVDGPGAVAELSPMFIAADPLGAIYVLEQTYQPSSSLLPLGLRLRKVAANGMVTTLVSGNSWWGKAEPYDPSGAQGPNHVTITAAGGIAVDGQGNIYVCEQAAHWGSIVGHGGSIVKITPDGVATVFAGKHDLALPDARVDGLGEAARFFDAAMLGFDADGNLYVDDGAIRKITPAGMVSTVSALPPGFNADADGNVYRIEGATVIRIAPNGTRTVIAGVPGQSGTLLGVLPGSLYEYRYADRTANGGMARIGPKSYAVISGSAVLKLMVP